MYYHDHLLVDCEHPLQFVMAPYHVAKSEQDEALDAQYIDVLPLAPIVRVVDEAHCPTAQHPRHAAELRARR